jgi:hypothetical protein
MKFIPNRSGPAPGRRPTRPLVRRLLAATLLGTVAGAGAAEPAAQGPESGVWVRREVSFTYLGFTSHYTCDGLESKVRTLLKLAGARNDMKVVSYGCGGRFELSPFPAVRAQFWTFSPGERPAGTAAAAPSDAPPGAAGSPAKQLGRDAPKLKRGDQPPPPEPGTAAWKTVRIDGRTPSQTIEAGDCELVEQFAREVLPLFTTRNLDNQTRCTPHQSSPFDVRLAFDVLAPVPTAEPGRPASR